MFVESPKTYPMRCGCDQGLKMTNALFPSSRYAKNARRIRFTPATINTISVAFMNAL